VGDISTWFNEKNISLSFRNLKNKDEITKKAC